MVPCKVILNSHLVEIKVWFVPNDVASVAVAEILIEARFVKLESEHLEFSPVSHHSLGC